MILFYDFPAPLLHRRGGGGVVVLCLLFAASGDGGGRVALPSSPGVGAAGDRASWGRAGTVTCLGEGEPGAGLGLCMEGCVGFGGKRGVNGVKQGEGG